ncbi:hypothetical protein [uncultured Polaribacter sp.]|uniref:hypothetical protein n=1 Tax=uncultured Polaribacter sp. TaxID=174711 RepID=UPI00260B2E0A|nr:hypothetical protein [uncultured Polaribacter sp.]
MKLQLLALLFFSFSISVFSQETITESNSIESQFDKIYRTSTSYQVYKVISKERYQKLKLNVLDSLKSSKKTFNTKDQLLKTEIANIKEVKKNLSNTQAALSEAIKKEESISLFGIQLNKTTYNIILWSIITALILALAYFIFKFFRSNILTKEAQNNLIDVEQEFEIHRKKSLEREQKLRRQLQDEINKQRNS